MAFTEPRQFQAMEEALSALFGKNVQIVESRRVTGGDVNEACKLTLTNGKQIFVNGHPEYDRYTLHNEYHRDLNKGLPIHIPYNYYPNYNPEEKPLLQWRSHSNNLYSNWLNYYVYQVTPYDL